MTYLATGFVVVWTAGLLFLVGRAFNFSRLALNNIVPGKPYWDHSDYYRHYFSSIFRRRSIIGLAVDPESLTEVGRQYQKSAIRNERISLAWMAGGVVPLVWAVSYLMAP